MSAAVRRARLRAQMLAGADVADPVEVVRALTGIQAQDRPAALLALSARSAGGTAADAERALAGGGLVRTWAMRGTLHLVAAEDLGLLGVVYGDLALRRGARRLAQLGLAPEAAQRSSREAGRLVAEAGPLTRHELAAGLRGRGVAVGGGQAPVHVVARAAAAGVLVEVGTRDGEPVYGPAPPGRPPERGAALVELARRYEAAHRPAGAGDFARWSGLPADDVRRGWAGVAPASADASEPGGVRLLGAFDEWLLGWADRSPVVATAHAQRVAPGGGIIRPVAIDDGRAFGTWRLDRSRGAVELTTFGRSTAARRAGVAAEVARIGAFLETPLELT